VAAPRTFDLAGFTGRGHERGRHVGWQAAWVFVQHAVWKRWWFPRRFRPAVLRSFGARVGAGCVIRSGVRVHWPWKLELGDHVWLGEGAWLLNLEPITIGSDTCVSQEALLCTGSHHFSSPTFEYDNGPIEVGSRTWIGCRAIVLRGVTVADDALVPAGTVVSRDWPASTRTG
jgi:putative colanic acid biosynthesis acetyltransferase WcaF